MSATVLHYTHPALISDDLYDLCLEQLKHVSPYLVYSVSAEHNAPRTIENMYRTMLYGLEDIDTDWTFFAEHDCLYPASRFAVDLGRLPDTGAYDINIYTMSAAGMWPAPRKVSSGYVGRTWLMRELIKDRLAMIARGERIKWSEINRDSSICYSSRHSTIDIRHGGNLTEERAPRSGVKQYVDGFEKSVIDRALEIITPTGERDK